MSENRDSCDMRAVVDWPTLHDADQLRPGDFEIYDTVRSAVDLWRKPREGEEAVTFKVCMLCLPGGHVSIIPLRPVPAAAAAYNGGHSWQWDGNVQKPTLQPSVNSIGNWHGWIRDGRMVSC